MNQPDNLPIEAVRDEPAKDQPASGEAEGVRECADCNREWKEIGATGCSWCGWPKPEPKVEPAPATADKGCEGESKYMNRGGEVWERTADGERELFAADVIKRLIDLERKLAAELRSWSQLTNELADMRVERLELQVKLNEARTALEKVSAVAGDHDDAQFGPQDDFTRGRRRGRDEAKKAVNDFVGKALARIDAGNETSGGTGRAGLRFP